MTTSRNSIWQEMIQLSPLCSGSLHEQYLPCGKAACRCHDIVAWLHGPFLWIGDHGKQVNRTLRPGPIWKVKEASNYHRFQGFSPIFSSRRKSFPQNNRGEGKTEIRETLNISWNLRLEPLSLRGRLMPAQGGTVSRFGPTGCGGGFVAALGKWVRGAVGDLSVADTVTGSGVRSKNFKLFAAQ
jgi:hypothetical protein